MLDARRAGEGRKRRGEKMVSLWFPVLVLYVRRQMKPRGMHFTLHCKWQPTTHTHTHT